MKHKKTKSIHAAIGDVAARISFGWSWGRDDKQEQEYAKMICRAVGVKVRKCPLPKNLQGPPLSSQNDQSLARRASGSE
jgi:hypothetical protein